MSMGNDRHWNADEDSKLMNQYKPYFDKLDDSKWEYVDVNNEKYKEEVLAKYIEGYSAKYLEECTSAEFLACLLSLFNNSLSLNKVIT